MRVLITGITGFVGSYLADYILEHHPEVELFGACRWRSPLDNIKHLIGLVPIIVGDLIDPSAVRHILEASKPDRIFHLAAQSYVPASFRQPRETLNTNIMAELNLLHGLREKLAGSMLVAGSSEEYGKVERGTGPINEQHELLPLSPYAVSKVCQDLLAYQYNQAYGVHVVRTRAFNHEGPRRGDVFATSAFCKQIAQIETGLQKNKILVGNLEAIRDYTDVRDIVKGYWLALEKGSPGDVYNFCSGAATGIWYNPANNKRIWSISELLTFLLKQAQVTDIEVVKDPERYRPADVPFLFGDFTKANQELGWKPEIRLEQTWTEMLAFWRNKIVALGN